MIFIKLEKTTTGIKKYKMTFFKKDKNGFKRIKTTRFGQAGASDFTIHKDEDRKQLYLDRHRKRENWDDYMSAGSLSRFLLWNKPTLQASLKDYRNKFNLKIKK